jgi:N-methylhydantoinase B
MAGDRGGTGIHNAFGTRADGSPWVSVAQCGGEIGPFGANRHGDADSQMFSYLANGIGVAAEAVEADVPVVMLRHEIVCDSAGPGYHRGGAAVVRDSLWLAPAAHSLMTLRSKRLSGFGVNGGGAGGPCGVWVYDPPGNGGWAEPPTGEGGYAGARALAGVIDPETGRPSPDGEFVYPFAQPFVPTAPLSVLRYVCNGGGGWGDPLTREPERVLVDVRDGYVSLEAAAREYGVVVHGDPDLDPEGLVVDVPATSKLRAEHHDARAGMEG